MIHVMLTVWSSTFEVITRDEKNGYSIAYIEFIHRWEIDLEKKAIENGVFFEKV